MMLWNRAIFARLSLEGPILSQRGIMAPLMSDYSLPVLAALETEAIHILREVATESQRPVMMYSVGKDSSVPLTAAET